jgi:ABC-type sugar transport system permease subunit
MANRAADAPRGFLSGRKSRQIKESLTAYVFLLPAFLIIFVFGLWPVVHALYVSLHKWNIKPKGSQCLPYWLARAGLGSPEALERTDCLGLSNYAEVLGLQDVVAVALLVLAVLAGVAAYGLWRRANQVENGHSQRLPIVAGLLAVVAAGLLILSLPGLIASGEWTYLVSIGLVVLGWLVWKGAARSRSDLSLVLRLVSVCVLLSSAAFFFFVDFQRIWDKGSEAFIKSIIRTVFYSAGTVPVQLTVSLLLAYILFQGVKAQGAFRLVYFMPYIAPSVATAVVFKRIFSLRDTGLMNQALGLTGVEPLRWLHEAKAINPLIVDLINQALGTNWTWPDIGGPLGFFLSGPSLALVSIIIYNWWVFIGYDTVIYLAGLGSIPHELYEAAEIDGAGRWAVLRRITIPLLSPTTFFLTVIATIGTFKAFNHIFVMRQMTARDATDTASILIYDTFRADGQFGEAAAMAFVLLGIILALTQIQNRVGEKLVFYG